MLYSIVRLKQSNSQQMTKEWKWHWYSMKASMGYSIYIQISTIKIEAILNMSMSPVYVTIWAYKSTVCIQCFGVVFDLTTNSKGSTINHLGGRGEDFRRINYFSRKASGFNLFLGEPPVSIIFLRVPQDFFSLGNLLFHFFLHTFLIIFFAIFTKPPPDD